MSITSREKDKEKKAMEEFQQKVEAQINNEDTPVKILGNLNRM